VTPAAAIRRLGPEDAALAANAVRTFKEREREPGRLEAFLRNPANYYLVAESGGALAGFLTAHRLERADRDEAQMFVYEVGVAEAWRRRGVGAALLEEITRLARAAGMFEAFVLTSRDNDAARPLYAGAGGVVEDAAAMLYVYPFGKSSEGDEKR
jgi:ribosomal protein S18 acetylase RimI-like enzyme